MRKTFETDMIHVSLHKKDGPAENAATASGISRRPGNQRYLECALIFHAVYGVMGFR